jgi:hypothetical protein
LLPVIHLGVLVASTHQEHKTNLSLTGRNTKKSITDSVNLSNAVEETERIIYFRWVTSLSLIFLFAG